MKGGAGGGRLGTGGGGGTGRCSEGDTKPCYTGDPSTEHTGICHPGNKICGPDGVYGACDGEQLPKAQEDCSNHLDDDCNGTVNDGCDAGMGGAGGGVFSSASSVATTGSGGSGGGGGGCAPDYVAAVETSQPLAYYRLGEASGPTATNAVGNGLNGSFQASSSLTFGQTGAIACDHDTAIRFDGGYVDVPNFPAFEDATSNFTLEAWVHPDSLPPSMKSAFILGRCYVSSLHSPNGGAFIALTSTGQVVFRRCSLNTGCAQTTTTAAISMSGYTHVAAVFQNPNLTIYVDGSAASPNGSASSMGNDPGTGALEIGNDTVCTSVNVAFDGEIDEAAVYTVSLMGTEIQDHYDAGVAAQ